MSLTIVEISVYVKLFLRSSSNQSGELNFKKREIIDLQWICHT